MKKKGAYRICYLASTLFVIGLPIQLMADYARYSSTLNSAPFRLWVMVDCLYFLLPAVILFLIGNTLKKKSGKPRK